MVGVRVRETVSVNTTQNPNPNPNRPNYILEKSGVLFSVLHL